MIGVENIKIADVPLLHIAQQDQWNDELPFIIFNHGFTSRKEFNLHYAYLLAEKGFRVVLPGALYHGERNAGQDGYKLSLHFWDIVLQSIEELEIIKESFEDKNIIDPERIGVVGTSMGGIVTLGALVKYPWIRAAVSLMGNPHYEKFSGMQIDELKKKGYEIPLSERELSQLRDRLREYDLSLQPEKLNSRPLLFWHGEKDPVVPFKPTYHFYETIIPLYQENPEKLKFIRDSHAGHKVSAAGVLETVKWFETYL
jgi:uncharacterized protein